MESLKGLMINEKMQKKIYFPWEKTPGHLSRSTFIEYNVVQKLIYFIIFKWNKQTISKKYNHIKQNQIKLELFLSVNFISKFSLFIHQIIKIHLKLCLIFQ